MSNEKTSKVNDNTEINDIRTQPQFRGITFSNFKKPDVRKQFIENMKKGKLEPACYWCAELVCAGHFAEVWEIILHYTGKHIHLGNPKMVIYLEKRFEIFRNIIGQGQYISELQLRNHPIIRKLFAEVVSVLTLSNKKHSFEPIKINRVEEYDITQMTERLKAPNVKYVEDIFKPKDPKELFIAINEFAYNISSDKHNMLNACYWIEWMVDFELICKKRKEPCHCEHRNYIPVDKKFQKDVVWLVWDALFHYCSILNNQFIIAIMKSIHELFCIKYTTAAAKKRRYLLYFAVALLTEPVDNSIELMSNKPMVQSVVDKINLIYKQIKKNEQSPNTDYLFANLEKENAFEQSMRKMELVNSMDIFNNNT